MLLFTKYKCTWLTAIIMSLSRCLTCRDVCVEQSHATQRLLPKFKVNLCGFGATVLWCNKDQQQNNPLATFANRLCRQRKRHEWTASSSLHDTITVNLTLVQREFHTGKKTVIARIKSINRNLWCRRQAFREIVGSNPNFQGKTGISPPCERPCDHWLFYIRFHKQGQLI